jgi:hypothetical protein
MQAKTYKSIQQKKCEKKREKMESYMKTRTDECLIVGAKERGGLRFSNDLLRCHDVCLQMETAGSSETFLLQDNTASHIRRP